MSSPDWTRHLSRRYGVLVEGLERRKHAWRKHETVYKRVYRLYAAEYIRRHPPVLVYQMGKVGSTSIKNSLRLQGVSPVYRVHVLNLENLDILYPRDLAPLQPAFLEDKRRNAPLAGALRGYVLVKHKPVKIITPVREPIARNISLFFENLFEFHIPAGSRYDPLGTEELTEVFIAEVRHATALTWFDVEMKANLGIDVYRYPFPQEKGYLTIHAGNVDLLLLKIELDDQVKARAIAGFLGIEGFHLIRGNLAQDKAYAQAYREFLQNVTLPPWYIETMCRSQYTRHFYSDAESERMRARWYRTSPGCLPSG